MGGTWLAARLQLRDDARRQYLAEFHAPLVKTVDRPHRALGKYAMLIKSHEAAEALRGERIRQNDIGWPVSLHHPERYLESGSSLCRKFLGRLAECQPLGLREEIGHQEIVMLPILAERPTEADEIAWNKYLDGSADRKNADHRCQARPR